MPKTEIEFKIRLSNKEARDIVHKKLSHIFELRLKERRHLESDFVYHIPGDIKLRGRFWQEFFANSTQLNVQKLLTLKLPRSASYQVVDNNEVEFSLDPHFETDENYHIAKNTLEQVSHLEPAYSFKTWVKNLVKVHDIYHFERFFSQFYPHERVHSRDKIRLLYTTTLDDNQVEICFDELPSRDNPLEPHYFIEFSCDNRTTHAELQSILETQLGILASDLDMRGYGKIIHDEKFGFKFKSLIKK